MLPRPGRLDERIIRVNAVRLVPEYSQILRQKIRLAEQARGADLLLFIEGSMLQALVLRIEPLEEGRIVRVDDQEAHGVNASTKLVYGSSASLTTLPMASI